MQTLNPNKLKLLKNIKLLCLDKRSQTVCVRDFNFFYNCRLEVVGRNPCFKRKFMSTFFEKTETLDLCDI